MCEACKMAARTGGCAIATDFRNAIVPGDSDNDHGPGTHGKAAPELTPEDINRVLSLEAARYQRLSHDMAFDSSHPVDEYAPIGNPGAISTLNVQPDYDMPELIQHVTYILPVGTTAATLQLGPRYLKLYSGTALTVPIVTSLHTGLVLNSDDPRQLSLTGATDQPYLGLQGFALTRGQFS